MFTSFMVSNRPKRSVLLKRMFQALTGEQITPARYIALVKEYSSGEDEPVERDAVKLMTEMGVMYVSEGLIIEEVVVAL